MELIEVHFTLKAHPGSPLLYGGPLRSPRNTKGNETADAYEERCWRERAHADSEGQLYIPGMAIKKMLDGVARFLKQKVPSKGSQTYIPYFGSGIFVASNMVLDKTLDDIEAFPQFVPSDGKPGGGSRVWRTFPLVRDWSGDATIHILHPVITEQVFREHLEQAGIFIGLGMWRPERKGFYGRFRVEQLEGPWPKTETADRRTRGNSKVADREAGRSQAQ